jgi:hypothetical protein
MAIFSCAVSTVGRSTHAAGTAGAHLRYIGRADAATTIEAAHMPSDPQAARTWMDAQEREARKNARLCSKIRVALPRELSREQNADLMREFVMQLTGGRVPRFYAIHDRGKDRHNPHAHLVLIDRDFETGKRVLRLSDSPKDREKAGLVGNGVEWIRATWEACANLAMERAGHEARIDRRSLALQGIDRVPTIHIGPRANQIDRTIGRPDSKVVPSPTPRRPDRVIDYPMIDAGRTRRERNAEIIDFNLEKAVRSPDFETRLWAQFEREQRVIDRLTEGQRVTAARRRTLEERRLRSRFKAQLREVRGKRHAEAALVRGWINQRLAPEIASLKARQHAQSAEMQRHKGRLINLFRRVIDMGGQTKRKRVATALRELGKQHKRERAELAAHIRQTRAIHAEAVRVRYQPEIDAIKQSRRQQVAGLKERHHDEMLHEDAALQRREAEREQGRESLKQQIDAWKKAPPESSDRQTAIASRLGADWNAKDEPARPPVSGELNSGAPCPDNDDGPS